MVLSPTTPGARSVLEPAFPVHGLRAWVVGAVFVIVYVAAAIAGLEFALLSPQVTPVWLPTGLSLGTLLLFGRRLWPAVFVAATIVNARQIGWPADASMAQAVGLIASALVVGAGNAAEAYLAHWLCEKLHMRLALDRVRDAAALFLVASPVAPIISAVAGASSLAVSGRIPAAAFWSVLEVWYVGNLIGFMVATPLVICVAGRGMRRTRKALAAEWIAIPAALVVATLLTFYKPVEDERRLSLSLAFVPLAVLAVGAIRLGPRGSAVLVAMLTFGSAAGTIARMGPFGMPSVHESLVLLWIYIGVSAIMAGFLASISAERETAIEAYEESERRLRRLADHVDAVYWVFDVPTRRVVFVSDAFARVFASPDAEPGSRETWLRSVHPDDHAKLCRIDAKTPLPQDVTYRVVHSDGSIHWLHERLFPLRDTGGRNSRIGGVASDITTLVEAEEQRRLMEARDEQSKKLESLGVIAGGVAHDFNNLLVAVIGNARMIATRSADSATSESAHKIIQTAQHAADLTRQLLTTAGRGALRPERADLEVLVREYIPLVFDGPEVARISIEQRTTIPTLAVVDPTQVRQVVLNLITNAIEASNSLESPIAVRVGVCRLNEESIEQCVPATRASPGEFVYIEVSDRGCGMSDETQHRMFEPFFSTKFAGRGLGMASVLGIMNAHRGAIHVASEVGIGTSIRVLFPRDHTRDGPPIETPAVHTAPPQREQKSLEAWGVLVVDDEPLVRDLAVQALRLAGLTVTSARDGHAAIDAIEKGESAIGLVLLDLTMPGMSGEETLAAIRSMRKELPVVVTTGAPDRDLIARLVSDPNVSFIAKPYSIEDLTEAVRAGLAHNQPVSDPSLDRTAEPDSPRSGAAPPA